MIAYGKILLVILESIFKFNNKLYLMFYNV